MAVSLDDAKLHIHVTDPARDAEVQMYLDQALALIDQYLGTFVATAPEKVRDAATLKMLGHLYEHRGDDSVSVFGPGANIWNDISATLMRSRDPALA